ncbi:MAG TPA: cytochrome c [Steroidobacteraceae bacterium]|jgi:mono/diheme cytochrome c family protein
MRGPVIVPMAFAPSSARVLLLMLLSTAIIAAACLLSNASARPADNDGSDTSRLHTGQEIYQAACVACHGPDGSGAPKTMVGFEKPATFPNFSECDQTAPEYTRDWKAVIRDGGPARGFSEIMPAFGDVFTPEQIDRLAEYLRSLCGKKDKERTWPPGELNLPRAMVTEKAFPEDEVVLTTSVAAKGAPGVTNDITYEYRIDGRNQLEVALPVSSLHRDTGGYDTGIGDLALGLKHVFFWNLDAAGRRGSIFAVQSEIVLPTGNSSKGFGTGEATLGVFGSYDVLLPQSTFLQFQAGGDFPRHTQTTPNDVFARSAFGASFSGGGGFSRQWSPMLELVADRNLQTGATTNWDLVPQFQVTLNTRQHIRADLAYRLALNNTTGRANEVMFYFLWDWFDGGLFEGW